MAKKKVNKIELADFPEEITGEDVKIYGETSYENYMAVLSHFLHNHQEIVDRRQKEEFILAVREFRDVMRKAVQSVKYYLSTTYIETLKR